jgi:hypothetical protein
MDILFIHLDKPRLEGKPLEGGGNVTALDFLWTCDLAWRSPDRPPVYIRSVIVLPPALPSFLL